jgi:hypothetical protein
MQLIAHLAMRSFVGGFALAAYTVARYSHLQPFLARFLAAGVWAVDTEGSDPSHRERLPIVTDALYTSRESAVAVEIRSLNPVPKCGVGVAGCAADVHRFIAQILLAG